MAGKPFDVKTRESFGADGVVVDVTGFLDAHTVVLFEARMNDLVDNGVVKIVIDLSGLSYISSAGIGAMMSLVLKLRRSSGDLILSRPSAKVSKILDLLGFSRIFKIFQDEKQALAEFGAKPAQ